MARDLAYWYNAIATDKQTRSTLDSLAPNPDTYNTFLADMSSSKVADWRLWTFIVAFMSWTLDKFFDFFKADVTAIANAAIAPTGVWFVDRVKKFQYGDTLVFANNTVGYAVVDETKQIVKRVSVSENSNGTASIKAAKLVSNVVTPLSAPELTALQAFVTKIQPPGLSITVASDSTDLAKLYINIYYNPLYVLADLTIAVEAAINNYLANISFDGKVELSRLVDAIQAVSGVVDVQVTDAQAKSSSGSYLPFTRVYSTKAGYIQVDPAFPLSTTLTFIGQ
jgi:hypothetical protein